MFMGIDPLYILMGLVTLLIVVILVMCIIMVVMVHYLRGINIETKVTSGHLRAIGEPVIAAAHSVTQPIYLRPRIS